jgi:putative endonuclease
MKKYEFYLYILKCADKSYYTGVTNDLEKRLSEHKNTNNMKSYIYHKRPFKLVYIEVFNDIREAISREKQIKGWSRKKKEALINQDWELLHNLAICKNWTNFKNMVSSFDSAQDDTSYTP